MSKYTGKFFVFCDGRSNSIDLERAAVVTTAVSEAEARESNFWFRSREGIWYELEVIDGRIVDRNQRLDLLVA